MKLPAVNQWVARSSVLKRSMVRPVFGPSMRMRPRNAKNSTSTPRMPYSA